ncbi:MAG: redoxin domain-containing protein [Chitinophagales bacterium]
MALQIGDLAPNFTLPTTNPKVQVSLEDYKGKNVLILFFPLAFTGVCTAEMCSMRDSITQYNNMNTDVVGISVDSPFSLGKFKAENDINFPLLSDFNKGVSPAYGAFYDLFFGLQGVSKRAAFVVDGEGAIQYAEVLESAGDLPNFESIKTTLTNLS